MTELSLTGEAPTGPTYIPTKYYQNMSKGIEVMERTRMHLRMIAVSPEPKGGGRVCVCVCVWGGGGGGGQDKNYRAQQNLPCHMSIQQRLRSACIVW